MNTAHCTEYLELNTMQKTHMNICQSGLGWAIQVTLFNRWVAPQFIPTIFPCCSLSHCVQCHFFFVCTLHLLSLFYLYPSLSLFHTHTHSLSLSVSPSLNSHIKFYHTFYFYFIFSSTILIALEMHQCETVHLFQFLLSLLFGFSHFFFVYSHFVQNKKNKKIS